MGNVSVKVDCTACGQTGYSNYFTQSIISGYYVPRQRQRWNHQRGGYDFTGDSAIKIDASYADLIDRATHLEFNGKSWNFEMLRDPGAAMGQERLVLSLTRKV